MKEAATIASLEERVAAFDRDNAERKSADGEAIKSTSRESAENAVKTLSSLLLACQVQEISPEMLLTLHESAAALVGRVLEEQIKRRSMEATEAKVRAAVEEALRTERQLKEEEQLCAVCLDLPRDCIFNCGHMACMACGLSLRVCHICRGKITSRQRTYS